MVTWETLPKPQNSMRLKELSEYLVTKKRTNHGLVYNTLERNGKASKYHDLCGIPYLTYPLWTRWSMRLWCTCLASFNDFHPSSRFSFLQYFANLSLSISLSVCLHLSMLEMSGSDCLLQFSRYDRSNPHTHAPTQTRSHARIRTHVCVHTKAAHFNRLYLLTRVVTQDITRNDHDNLKTIHMMIADATRVYGSGRTNK